MSFLLQFFRGEGEALVTVIVLEKDLATDLRDPAEPKQMSPLPVVVLARNSSLVGPAKEERMTILHIQGGGGNEPNRTEILWVSGGPDIVVMTTNLPCQDRGEIVGTVQAMTEIRVSLVDLGTATE